VNAIMDFSDALRALKAGHRMSRVGWNGAHQWIALQEPDEHSAMGLPYLFIRTVSGQLVPWLASQTDLLAVDWYEVEE
jgi:hypothetical protein